MTEPTRTPAAAPQPRSPRFQPTPRGPRLTIALALGSCLASPACVVDSELELEAMTARDADPAPMIATGFTGNEAATMALQARARKLAALQRAHDFLATHPLRASRMQQATLDAADAALVAQDPQLLQGAVAPLPSMTLPDLRTVALQDEATGLFELGAAIQEFEDVDNLRQLYSRTRALTLPASASFPLAIALSDAELIDELRELVDHAAQDLPSTGAQPAPPVDSPEICEAELGADQGTDLGGASCESWAATGIMGNVAFTLREHQTCVKDQGRRGTCTAFATMAALESALDFDGEGRVNLSEQHFYFVGKTHYEHDKRYDYGLNAANAVQSAANRPYSIPFEQSWNYNPSLSITGNKLGNMFVGSCTGYAGELCTGFAFQGNESTSWNGSSFDFTYTAPYAPGFEYDVSGSLFDANDLDNGLLLAILYLNAGIPIVSAVDVAGQWSTLSNGYAMGTPGAVAGGHALALVGWVANEDLPAGAPLGSGGGYFVAKNSWDVSWGDCGYVYIPYDSMRATVRSLSYVIL